MLKLKINTYTKQHKHTHSHPMVAGGGTRGGSHHLTMVVTMIFGPHNT